MMFVISLVVCFAIAGVTGFFTKLVIFCCTGPEDVDLSLLVVLPSPRDSPSVDSLDRMGDLQTILKVSHHHC